MKRIILFMVSLPILAFANEVKLPSTIETVTVYLSGAQITRTLPYVLNEGTSEIVLTGLSPKIDENSIQISGLQGVSILTMSYDINYINLAKGNPESIGLQNEINRINEVLAKLENQISGLKEEEKVITTNRVIHNQNEGLNLEELKRISTYYRERITTLKNEIFEIELQKTALSKQAKALKHQLAELNNQPEKKTGELTLTLDAPVTTSLNLSISYLVTNAGWIPNYDIKSNALNDPLQLTYKAHVYQKTGVDWNDVNVILSSGSPNTDVTKPQVDSKYLNFIHKSQRRAIASPIKNTQYHYNPTVKRVVGKVIDESGLPLPGCSVIVKGTTQGTQTDFDGNYAIDLPEGRSLVFSYIGFGSQEIPIYSSHMNVSLNEDAAALEEVVVTAMATKRNKSTLGYATGAVSTVALEGRAPGVQVRGTKSISSALRTPLYVIDGVPEEGFREGDLDLDQIASVNVLSQENAEALYGQNGNHGVIVITTKKSSVKDDVTRTKFILKKSYSIASDGDVTAMEINTFALAATYQYFAAPLLNENVFLTATFSNWEQYNLLPGETSIYFNGSYAGKTNLNPYNPKKEMVVSLGIEPNITVDRKQNKNFKRKSFTGTNRVVNRSYALRIKNNKGIPITLKLVDRIPISQHKEIKVTEVDTPNAIYDSKKGLLQWEITLASKEVQEERFAFQVKYPKYKNISL